MFIHHPEGRIKIDDEEFTLEEFIKVEPGYSLPPGATGRNYNGKAHVIIGVKGKGGRGAVPWEEGDGYIQKKDNYRLIIDASKPPPPGPPTDAERIESAFSNSDHTQVVFAVLHDLENRLLGLEVPPKSALSVDAFKALLATKLPS